MNELVPSDLDCHHCSYRLAGLRALGRCPECGAFIADSLHVYDRKARAQREVKRVRSAWSDVHRRAVFIGVFGASWSILALSMWGMGPDGLLVRLFFGQAVFAALALGVLAFFRVIVLPPMPTTGLCLLAASTPGIGIAITLHRMGYPWRGLVRDFEFRVGFPTTLVAAMTLVFLLTPSGECPARTRLVAFLLVVMMVLGWAWLL